ncbi:Sec6p [Saccharomyces cerevisiae YJM1273]|nr:Sec6p [Saccharomyces cerevisiae YJM1273]AJR50702.1 Sec6p [Saccharomyces cerevisiae YJM1434]CAI4386554.1 AVI_1a_G0026430.mRNA.1.CDS.1 [Saccharomyces cerevisiae]CAI4404025.1 ANE_G0026390.mRNA.1.CDS.1 [Saccharomyces cerevisiae]CAI6602684.1 ANE_G0026390.mRNA.1.CDS.1 [Saccharomyces cerevisiae]
MSSDPLQQVCDLIKGDLSLERVRDIKEQLLKEKSVVEYQLNKESDKYYGEVEESLKLLNLSKNSVTSIKQQINEVNKLGNDNRFAINRYDILFRATKLYETVNTTSSIYDRIYNFVALMEHIERLLVAELAEDALETGCPHLLEIHFLLTSARDFQEQVVVMAKEATEDAQRTVMKLFSRLSGIISKFDKLLDGLTYDIVEMARAEQISLAIRLFKIYDLEEREDLRIEAIRNIIKKKEIEIEKSSIKKLPNSKNTARLQDETPKVIEYPTNKGLYQEIMSGTISTRTAPRGYKHFLINGINNSISEMFGEMREKYVGDQKFDVLDNMDWIFNELIIVKEHIANCCPPHWNIFEVYFDQYYKELHSLITDLVESEPETIIILDILAFDKTFQDTLKQDFGFTKSEVKSVIGDKEKETLFKDYLNLIVIKMTEWIGNLEKAEFDVFLERSTPPHSDSDGLLFLDGTKTCFQMFTQQVEVAAGTNQAKILVGVVERFSDLLTKRQKNWISKISEEIKKQINYNHKYDIDPESITPEDECPGGLVEYLIAVSNDQMKAADYAVAISSKYGKLVSKVYEKQITNHLEGTLDGFAEVAQCSSLGLITLMFDDLRKPYQEIFSKTWYMGSQAQQIADTLDEYLLDIKPQMNSVLFVNFIDNVIGETIIKFLTALSFEHSFKNKNNKFLEAMKRDFEIFYQLFVKVLDGNESKDTLITQNFTVMEFFMDLSCEPIDSILDIWQKYLEVYWDSRIDLLVGILKCRKDVSSSERKKIVQQATEMLHEYRRNMEANGVDREPTLMRRFVLEFEKQ